MGLKSVIDSIHKIPLPKSFDFKIFDQWFQPEKEFYIEIGCGVGLHPIKWAIHNPSKQLLAIERTSNKFSKFQRRLSHHPNIRNLLPAHADAAQLLPHLLFSNRFSDIKLVDGYFILYPNPYPKASQKNLRFAHHALTDLISRSLKPKGHVIFATNIKDYCKELVDELPKKFGLDLNEHRLVSEIVSEQSKQKKAPNSDLHFPRTHFERKYLLRNEVCHNLVFSRNH